MVDFSIILHRDSLLTAERVEGEKRKILVN